jgi:glutathione S-transferase
VLELARRSLYKSPVTVRPPYGPCGASCDAGPNRRPALAGSAWSGTLQQLQPVPRRLGWWAARRNRSALRGFIEGARLHVPRGLAVRTAGPLIWAEVRINRATDVAVQADLAALPAMLDQVDVWLDEGVLGRKPPTAADYQIATSVRLLLCFEDLRETIGRRPAAKFARTLVSDFPGEVPAVFPEAWIVNLR